MRNVIAVVAGFIVGSVVNMALVMIGPSIIPLPAGVDPTDTASIAESMHLFEAHNFIVPFAAHALGTLAGAITAFVAATRRRAQLAYVIGALFFLGGIYAGTVIPAPAWFDVTDLALAYFPMAWLGTLVGRRLRSGAANADSV